MGTGGTGKFGDYGKSMEVEQCDKKIENELLENYGDYDYAKSLANPTEEIKVHIDIKDRIVVVDSESNMSIGALSTEYEYIRQCIKVKNYEFNGEIVSVENNGIVSIRVDLIGTKKKK